MDKKAGHIYTMQYYMAINKEILHFVTVRMAVETVMLSEISQSEKENYHIIEFICKI